MNIEEGISDDEVDKCYVISFSGFVSSPIHQVHRLCKTGIQFSVLFCPEGKKSYF